MDQATVASGRIYKGQSGGLRLVLDVDHAVRRVYYEDLGLFDFAPWESSLDEFAQWALKETEYCSQQHGLRAKSS